MPRKPKKFSSFVRIKKIDGKWYACGTGHKKIRNRLLVPAINFCVAMNRKINYHSK